MASPTRFKKSLLATSIAAAVVGVSPVTYAQDDGALEEVIVRGIRSSLEQSIDIKRESNQIVEAITADDIGKLPDQNVAESLQRLPGVQIDRRDGEGTQVRIRGLDQNITLLNGGTFTSGMEYFQLGEWRQEYQDSLEGVPSELLGGLEVYKTPRADVVEGGMGGIINLKTRSALDLDDMLLAANVKVDQGEDSADAQPSGFIVFGNNFNDNFAAIASLSMTKKTVQTDYMQSFSRENSGVRCTDGGTFDGPSLTCSTGQSYLVPGMWYVMDTEQERERLGGSVNLEWRISDAIEMGFDWFHNEMDITNVQYVVKHPMNTDGAAGLDETQPYTIDSSNAVGVVTSGSFITPGTETNTAGETSNSTADNYALKFAFDNGGNVRVKSTLQGSHAELEQRGGYADSRFSEYAMRAWVGTAGSTTGWNGTVVNPSPDGDPARWFSYRNGEQPNLNYANSNWLSDPDFHTYKSHWALGSDVEQDTFSFRADVEWDIGFKDLKTLSFGIRTAEEEVAFDELRWLTDFSRASNVQTPNLFDENGNISQPTNFDPDTPPQAAAMNAGIAEAVYYDLCGNGGIPDGNICDINGDGYDDNQPFGPWGYFLDAAIGFKGFDLTERLYDDQIATDNTTADPDALYTPNANGFGAVQNDGDGLGDYIERNLSFALYGDEFTTGGSRFGSSPGYLPWQTYTPQAGVIGATGDASRYVRVSDFFPSGGYANNNVVFQNGEQIAASPENWIQNVVAPHAPGQWFQVPTESWVVNETTTAFYGMADFEGDTVPYTLNVGLRVVETEVETTLAVTTAESALWSIATDSWNSQGVLLDWDLETSKKDYWDLLPSLNFVLDTSDSTKLRFSAARVIARPSLQDLGRGLLLNFTRVDDPSFGTYFGFTGGSGGNPNLDPFRATQADVVYEWYFNDLGLVSFGGFTKAVESFIGSQTQLEFRNDAGPGGGREGGISRPFNGSGGTISGLELIIQQAFDSGLGYSFNYTYTKSTADISSTLNEDLGLPGVSETAYNLMGFFENDFLQARLAYTWRDDYLSPYRSVFDYQGLENGGSEFYDSYGIWDASVTWDVLDNLSVNLEMFNLTDEPLTSYFAYPNNPMTYTSQERRMVVGVTFRL